MKIIRILNNNVVQAEDNEGNEIIVSGKGIAFNAKTNNIDESKIEKVFVLKKKNEQVESMLQSIPGEFWDFGITAVNKIEKSLDIELDQSFYVALVDHIYVSVERAKQNISLPGIFTSETKYLYPNVYKVAKEVVTMMSDYFNYEFKENEAGFISLHIIDAESDITNANSHITSLIEDVLKIVEKRFSVYPNNDTINGTRFLIHLKYLANKITNNENINNKDLYEAIYKNLIRDFPNHHACILEIVNMVYKKYNYDISSDEQCYLMIHLIKITE